MSDLAPIDYESLIIEKRADIRSIFGQLLLV